MGSDVTKIGFVSLGCPKNLVDSERMLGLLQVDGYTLVEENQPTTDPIRVMQYYRLLWERMTA